MKLRDWIWALFAVSLAAGQTPAKSWGVYQIHWRGDQFRAGIEKQIEQLGAVPDHILFFEGMNPRRGFPASAVEIIRSFDATPVISQEFKTWGRRSGAPEASLQSVAAGEWDEFWTDWAKEAAAFGDPVIVRLGYEMNGDWFPWGGQPEAFVRAWRRVHGIVREAGADNVRFMFSPNVVWDREREDIAIEPYYPGDAYVDLLGLDGYNFGESFSDWHTWQSFEEIFDYSIGVMEQWDKPLWISETGCAHGPRKAAWLRDCYARFREDPRLAGLIYFNFADGKNGEPDWRLDSDPASLAAVRKELEQGFGPVEVATAEAER